MDDDIPAAWSCGELPLPYRMWTSGRYWRVHRLLAAGNGELLVVGGTSRGGKVREVESLQLKLADRRD